MAQTQTVQDPSLVEVDSKDIELAEIEKIRSQAQPGLPVIDVAAERRLNRKIDWLIMPTVMLLYLFSCLDRNSLGNMRLLGMIGPRGLSPDPDGAHFSMLVSVFFIGYAALAIPFGMLAKRLDQPHAQVCLAAVVWGLASAVSATVHTWAEATGTRFLMSVGEAAFQPVVALMLAKWYSSQERASRFVWFYSTNAVSGVVNGLVGYALNFSHSSVAPWRLFYVINGTPTILLGLWAYWALPGKMNKTKRLSQAERELAAARLARRETAEGQELPWKQMISVLWSWPLMLPAVSNMCAVLVAYVINIFLPVLVKESGYSGATAQLMTLPAYGSALFTMLACGYWSDKKQRRGPFLVLGFCLMILGNIILAAIPVSTTVLRRNARYAGLCFMTNGSLIIIPLKFTWVTENAGNEARRAVAVPLVLAFGQAISTATGYMFPAKDSPTYRSGTFACLGIAFVGLFSTFAYMLLCIHSNRRRDRIEGKPEPGFTPDTAQYADKARGFRYKW